MTQRALTELSHVERVQRMLALGADGSPEARAELARLEGGDAFERWLSLFACFRNRDGERVLRAIEDPSLQVRRKALALVRLACTEAQALTALKLAYAQHQSKLLLYRLRGSPVAGAIDAYLDWLDSQGAQVRLIDELTFGSSEAVRRYLPAALKQPSQLFWRRLTQRHPAVMAEVLLSRWKAVEGEADPVTRLLTEQYMGQIAERAPDSALPLWALLMDRRILPPQGVLESLGRLRPVPLLQRAIEHPDLWLPKLQVERLAAADRSLLLQAAARCPHQVDWDSLLPLLPEDSRRALARAWAEVSDQRPRLFPAFAPWLEPDQAEPAYQAWSLAQRDAQGVIRPADLAGLPLVWQEREARRHLHEVVALHPHPARRIEGYARYLPLDEATESVSTALGHPDAALRGVALVELLMLPVARKQPEHVAHCLELLIARKHEQDPVRGRMLEALTAWPRGYLGKEHLPALARILRDALDASDLSRATAGYAERLVMSLSSVDIEWTVRWIEVLLRERGQVHALSFGLDLDDEKLQAIAPALLRIATSWHQQERFGWVLQLAQALGDKLMAVTGLVELLESELLELPWPWLDAQYVQLLARVVPERVVARLPALIERWRSKDQEHLLLQLGRTPSVAEASGVWALLGPEIERVARTTRHPWVLTGALLVLRERDRAAHDALLVRLLAEDPSLILLESIWRFLHRHRQDLLTPYLEGVVVTGRFATGKTAWLLPATSGFWRWTSAQNDRFAHQLARIVAERDRDTPTQLWAITRLAALPWAQMQGLCALADDDRPVIREKAIRLLARCDAGQGVPTLVRCLEDERARFAIYGLRRALLVMPPERAVALLRDAPMRKVTVAKEIVRLLGDIRCDEAYERLITIARSDLHRDTRIAVLRALWDHLHREATWAIYEAAVESPDWVLASKVGDIPADRLTEATDRRLSALMARLVGRPEPEARLALLQSLPTLHLQDPERVLLAAARERLASPYDDEVQAAIWALLSRQDEQDIEPLQRAFERLRSDPRALVVAADRLLSVDLRQRASWELAAQALERALAHEPQWTALRLRAAAAWRSPEDFAGLLDELGARGALGFDAMEAARAALAARSSDRQLRLLLDSRTPEVRRCALWALQQAVARQGWTAPHLEILQALRADDAPAVREAAFWLAPPRELGEVPRATPPPPR